MKNNEFDFTNSIEIIKDTDVYKNNIKNLNMI